MGGHLNLDGGTLNLDGGTLTLDGGTRPPASSLQFKYWLYADDSALTLSHKNVNCIQTMLNFKLPKINAWLKSNQFSRNVNKTNFLFFTKTKEKICPQINDCKIKQANCVKYLEVFLVDILSWKKHFETKLSAASGAIYKLCKYIPQKALMSVHYSLVYSHLQYAIT